MSTAFRSLSVDDAAAVLTLLDEASIAEIGEPNTTLDEVAAHLAGPHVTAVGVEGVDGLIGYAWAELRPGHPVIWTDVAVRHHDDTALLDTLLTWTRERAEELDPTLPFWHFADTNNLAKRKVFEAAGGTVIRRFYRMSLDFEASPLLDVPLLPEGVELRLTDGSDEDLRDIHRVIDTAFLDHFGHEPTSYEEWTHHVPQGCCPDLSLYWIAAVDGEPMAAVYCCELPGPGYVDCLGTLREARGKGLGRALLLTAFAEFKRRGFTRVVLGVDATNPTGALGLYESVGMTAAHEGWRYEFAPSG